MKPRTTRRYVMATKKSTKSKTASDKTKQPPKGTGRSAGSKKTEAKPKKPGALDAAVKVLEETGQPMSTREMIEEMKSKGAEARFKKVDRGRFALNG